MALTDLIRVWLSIRNRHVSYNTNAEGRLILPWTKIGNAARTFIFSNVNEASRFLPKLNRAPFNVSANMVPAFNRVYWPSPHLPYFFKNV